MFTGRERHYRRVGQSAWRCTASAMLAAGLETPRTVLDLPCGHGRVLRVLCRALPQAEFTACDIDRDGVDFCREEFGAIPVYSDADLERVEFATKFDLIWCGSLVTHLDKAGWLATFRLFIRSLRPGGVAVVTFHGRWVEHLLRQGADYGLSRAQIDTVLDGHARTGFGYADYRDGGGYGVSLSSPAWVLAAIAPWPELRVVALAERQWDDHQDVLAVQRL
ncbi:MAG: class I SAM-dependent methyltransferase [Planctomycetota bacterium]